MKTDIKTGRVVGVLFLLMIITGSISLDYRGLSTSLTESETFLQTVFENSFDMRIAILLDFIAALTWILIFIYVYPVLKKHLKDMSIWHFGFGFLVINFVIIVVSNISHLSLITLSKAFINADSPDLGYYRTLGKMSIRDYYSAHFFSLITYTIGAAALFYALFKTKIVPRFLSIWGIFAMMVVFGATWFQIFGYKVSFNFYMQNGLHIISFTLWLIIKGFSVPSKDSKPLE